MTKTTNKKSKKLHLGRMGELLAKAKFMEHDFDVFSTEVDDKGIDFIVRNELGKYFEIQVKTTNKNYVFMQKKVFTPKKNLYVLLLLINKEVNPTFILIPSMDWKHKRFDFLVERNYEGRQSPPEYGINISQKSIEILKLNYFFLKTLKKMV